jgi:hypothetical protein
LPRLGAMQLLQRKKGPCEDVADMTVFSLRSLGLASSIDVVPAWATSSGNHTLNTVITGTSKAIPYDVLLLSDSIKTFIREPAKVVRVTFSKQKSTLAYTERKENIPQGFMQLMNYKDVTEEYWPTANINCSLFISKAAALSGKNNDGRTVYACVLNYGKWQPVWWGKAKNNAVAFSNMCKGAVFLPMYYSNSRLVPAGHAVASGYKDTMTLVPDTTQKRTVTLKEQEHYLIYRPNKKYRLYYWNSTWKLIAEKTTPEIGQVKEMSFENVPKNALLMLVPEYTQRKERPFIINEKGERLWW